MVLCGISAPFGALSPCGGQVAHALLTRPPLELIDSIRRLPQQVPARLACVRHAASVRPEPGSNSYVQSVIALDLWKNSSLSESVLLKHDSLKILDCSCVLSLFCIVFKVRCSQASLYIIPRAHFSVNTFFEVFLLFLHLFSKPLFFNGFRFVRFALFFRLPPIFFVIVRPFRRFPPHFICFFYSIPVLSCSPSSLTFVEFFRHFCNFPSKPIDFLPIFGIYSIRIICSNTVVIRRRSLVSA